MVLLPLIFVLTMCFKDLGTPRRKLSLYQTWSLPLPILWLLRTNQCEKKRINRKKRVLYHTDTAVYSPTESPKMQLSIERSNLCLIEEHWNNLLHKFGLIEYFERSSVWQPRDCLRKLEKFVCKFEHGIELDREFRLCPSCGARARGGGWGSIVVAARSFFGTSIDLHFFHLLFNSDDDMW